MKKNKYFLIITLLFILLFSLKGVYGDDIWFHLATGRYIFQNKSIPTTDVFSHTADGLTWVNQNWLSDSIFYLIQDNLGDIGLGVFFALITALTFYFLYKTLARLLDNKHLSLLLAFFAGYFSITRFQARPEAGSYLLISVLIYLLVSGFSKKKLVLIPILFLLWANWQAGFVPVGFLILSAYLIFNILASVIKSGFSLSAVLKQNSLHLLIISAAVSLINPLGVRGIGYFFEVRPAYLKSDFTEWGSILRILGEPGGISSDQDFSFLLVGYVLFIVVAVSGLILVLLKKKGIDIRKDIFSGNDKWLIFLAPFVATPFIAFRFIPLAIISLALIISVLACEMQNYEISRKNLLTKLLYTLIVVASVVRFYYYEPIIVPQDNKTAFRTEMIAFIRDNDLKGNMFNPLEDGGYFIWKLPERKVFIDERLDVYTGSGIYDEYSQVYAFPPTKGFEDVLEKYDIELIILPGWQDEPMNTIRQSGNYSLVYWSDYFFMLVKTNGLNANFVGENQVKTFMPFKTDEYDKQIVGVALEEAMFLSEKSPTSASILTSVGGIYQQIGDTENAIKYFKESLVLNPNDYNVELNLGVMYAEQNSCYRAVNHLENASRSKSLNFKALVHRNLGFTYYNCLHDYEEAYTNLRKFVNIGKKQGFDPEMIIEAETILDRILQNRIIKSRLE